MSDKLGIHAEYIEEVKQQVTALRATVSSETALEIVGIVEAMLEWIVRIDSEIDELDSRIHYLERPDDQD